MNILTSILGLLIFLNINLAKSQKLKLYYNLEFVKDSIKKDIENRSMVLLEEKQNYIFCPEELLIKDSLKNNNLEYSPVIMDEEINFMVIRKNNIINKFYMVDEKLYAVNENSVELNWKIKNQTKIIDSIQCQLATLRYKGRNWEAWFSTKYPISIGPYIFNGLPGIILELKDTKNNYIFKLSKIKNTEDVIDHLINQSLWINEKPIFINNKQLKKLYLTVYGDPFRRMKEKKIIYMIDEKTGEKQPPPDFDKMTKSAQKYIRDNNNPIELSEVVQYPSK